MSLRCTSTWTLFSPSSTPVALIVAYVKRILSQYTSNRSDLATPGLSMTSSYSSIPTGLLSELFYVCRLIYSRTSGVLTMKRSHLHKTMAVALKIEVS